MGWRRVKVKPSSLLGGSEDAECPFGARRREGIAGAGRRRMRGRGGDFGESGGRGSGFGGMGRSAGDAGKAWESVTGGAPRRPRSGRPKAPRRTRPRTARTRAAETAPENVLLMLEPACVASCPQHAIEFGDIEELRRKHGTCAAIAPLPWPKRRRPRSSFTPGRPRRRSETPRGRCTSH